MPEGDTIHGLARRFTPQLVGRRIDAADLRELRGAEGLVGATITQVEAVGKHLLVHTDAGLTLRSHLGMNGRWDRVPLDASPRERPRIDLAVDGARWICTNPPQVELLRTADLARNETLARLGPDLLRPPVAYDEIIRRARHPANVRRPLGEVLIDQRVAAGFGNVFKSEMCFLFGESPWNLCSRVPDAVLRDIYARGAVLLEESVARGRRIFTLGPRGAGPRSMGALLWVYRRAGQACFECGGRVRQRRQGPLARVTYWCPRCQPLRAAEPAAGPTPG